MQAEGDGQHDRFSRLGVVVVALALQNADALVRAEAVAAATTAYRTHTDDNDCDGDAAMPNDGFFYRLRPTRQPD